MTALATVRTDIDWSEVRCQVPVATGQWPPVAMGRGTSTAIVMELPYEPPKPLHVIPVRARIVAVEPYQPSADPD